MSNVSLNVQLSRCLFSRAYTYSKQAVEQGAEVQERALPAERAVAVVVATLAAKEG